MCDLLRAQFNTGRKICATIYLKESLMVLSLSSFEEVHSVAENIEGWLSEAEARLLYDTVSTLKGDGAIVEIGSWCAKSLTYMTAGAIKGCLVNKIFSIDPFLTSKDEPNGKYETFIENLKNNGIYDKVTHIKQKSQIAGLSFDEKIEFLFIDGFHKYEAVKQDFELFYPKIIEGGYVAIHDITYYKGPYDLIMELAQDNTFKIVSFCDSIILAQKASMLSGVDVENNTKIIGEIKAKVMVVGLIE